MRQIIAQSHWSSSANVNANERVVQKASRTGLTVMEASSNRGETDSSFEVPGVSSSYRDRKSYSNQTPTKSFNRSINGSMQFVPADHESNDRFVASHETSWDAITNDSATVSKERNPSKGSVVTPSPPARRTMGRRGNSTGSSVDNPSRSGGGLKIARLASMFSSRAAPGGVPKQSPTPGRQQAVPTSPPRSESSTGYVGWPGTQDKRGNTVVAESSYEESDVSAENYNHVDETQIERNDFVDDHNAQSYVMDLPRRSPSGNEHEQDKIHRLNVHIGDLQSPYVNQNQIQFTQGPGYGKDVDTMSEISTSYSKTSSAYFNPGEVQATRNQNKNRLAAATVIRRYIPSSKADTSKDESLPTLTEERLAMQNRYTAPSRSFNYGNAVGYRGLLDRTKDVPNLIDDTTSDCTSHLTAATSLRLEENGSKKGSRHPSENLRIIDKDDERPGLLGATSRPSVEKLNLALLGGGLTTIQTTAGDFSNRKTASDFDETLTNSDCDQYGFTKIPGFDEMLSAGMSKHDRSFPSQSLEFAVVQHGHERSRPRVNGQNNLYDFTAGLNSDGNGDFTQYYINPEQMQLLVKKFRKISNARCQYFEYEDLEREEDATKAFALSEMRSRIMEKDIERGLERKGGTTVVDDIVMTSYNKAALRVRDAVIVAKAWHDGATPQDIVNTANLTRRDQRTYYIPRLTASAKGTSKYRWEEVNWIDDNELSQYRCHSLGPRHLKGVEMFTIGDCQSMLLKLSNDRCQELRDELNEATAKQINAEALMKAEGETFSGMMTEAEMTYLTSMEDVKSISQKLVLAEKSFSLVKDRIQKLVAKYEALLVHFENETDSVAPSSVFSYESSCYSEDYSFAAAKQREDETLARRAQRVELRAELAARESMLTSEETSSSRKEKLKEVNNLKAQIAELQSETSTAFADRDRSVALARALTRSNQSNQNGRVASGFDNQKRSKIDDIKQRFRNRSAAKFQFKSKKVPSNESSSYRQGGETKSNNIGSSFHRTVGEEMFQHLDFYERSLKAVGGH